MERSIVNQEFTSISCWRLNVTDELQRKIKHNQSRMVGILQQAVKYAICVTGTSLYTKTHNNGVTKELTASPQ